MEEISTVPKQVRAIMRSELPKLGASLDVATKLGIETVKLLDLPAADSDKKEPPAFLHGAESGRYDGDKLAFVKGTAASGCDWAKTIDKITTKIDEMRTEKRRRKLEIEVSKEYYIRRAKGELESKDEQKSKDERGGDPAAAIPELKRILRWYHYWVLENAGWRLEDILDEIRKVDKSLDFAGHLSALAGAGGEVQVRCPEGHTLYTICCGEAAYERQVEKPEQAAEKGSEVSAEKSSDSKKLPPSHWNVYIKRGYDQVPLSKNYVRDSNGVMTRRYVSRAFLVYNLATMFGVRLSPGGKVIDGRDADIAKLLGATARERLCRTLTNPDVPPEIRVVPGLSQQEPKYRGDSFGDFHSKVFDIRRAASYEPGGLINPDFAPYRSRGTEKQEYLSRLAIVAITGFCADRRKTDPMKRNERASMQVRNGSGPGQPFISTAATQEDYKLIRGNKGERFDDSAENIGTVLVDLSIAKSMGVDIINQHAPESDRFKIAYDRYFDQGDIEHAERAVVQQLVRLVSSYGSMSDNLTQIFSSFGGNVDVAKLHELTRAIKNGTVGPLETLAESLADLGVRPEDLGVTDKEALGTIKELRQLGHPDAVRHIVALQGYKFDHTSIVKRTAARELEEYIASARKNREVLLDRIPLDAIIALKLNDPSTRWPNFPSEALGERFEARGEGWYKMTSGFKEALKKYVVDDGKYGNLKAMFKSAAQRKLLEDQAGKGAGLK